MILRIATCVGWTMALVAFGAHATPPVGGSTASAEEHAARGDRLFDQGRWDDAAAEYKAALALVERPIYMWKVARCYEEKGERTMAATWFERVRRNPRTPDDLRQAADRRLAKIGTTHRAQASTPDDLIAERHVEALRALQAPIQRAGFRTSLIGGGKVLRITDAKGQVKVLVEPHQKVGQLRFVMFWGHPEGTRPTIQLLHQINGLNRAGYLKVYLDKDLDVTIEGFLPYRHGLSPAGLVAFTRRFFERGIAIAVQLSSYIQGDDG